MNYDCNHDCDAIYEAYEKGRNDAFTQKRTADGCTDCAFIDIEEWEMPCAKCKRASKDYWRPKEEKNV